MTSPINTTFTTGTTIDSGWLNGVNDYVNNTKGSTAQRPISPFIGLLYFDTSLAVQGKPIWFTGTSWVDATGTIV